MMLPLTTECQMNEWKHSRKKILTYLSIKTGYVNKQTANEVMDLSQIVTAFFLEMSMRNITFIISSRMAIVRNCNINLYFWCRIGESIIAHLLPMEQWNELTIWWERFKMDLKVRYAIRSWFHVCAKSWFFMSFTVYWVPTTDPVLLK